MAALPREGTVSMRVLDASAGPDDKGTYSIRVNVEITSGLDEGQRLAYSNRVDARSIPYIKRDCMAVGWKGENFETFVDDIEAWAATDPKTGKPSATSGLIEGEIQHVAYNDKKTGEPRTFAKVRSFGRGAKPLGKPTPAMIREANEALRNAEAFEATPKSDDEDGIPF